MALQPSSREVLLSAFHLETHVQEGAAPLLAPALGVSGHVDWLNLLKPLLLSIPLERVRGPPKQRACALLCLCRQFVLSETTGEPAARVARAAAAARSLADQDDVWSVLISASKDAPMELQIAALADMSKLEEGGRPSQTPARFAFACAIAQHSVMMAQQVPVFNSVGLATAATANATSSTRGRFPRLQHIDVFRSLKLATKPPLTIQQDYKSQWTASRDRKALAVQHPFLADIGVARLRRLITKTATKTVAESIKLCLGMGPTSRKKKSPAKAATVGVLTGLYTRFEEMQLHDVLTDACKSCLARLSATPSRANPAEAYRDVYSQEDADLLHKLLGVLDWRDAADAEADLFPIENANGAYPSQDVQEEHPEVHKVYQDRYEARVNAEIKKLEDGMLKFARDGEKREEATEELTKVLAYLRHVRQATNDAQDDIESSGSRENAESEESYAPEDEGS